jgi:fatty-acyl-CoA synthase
MRSLPTLAQIVATHARTQGERIAVRGATRTLTWCAWHERSSRLAQALRSLGLEPGDRVALLAYNAVEWLELYAAIAQAGLVAVPINFRLAGPEVAWIAEHAGARAFVVQEALRPVVEPLRPTRELNGIVPGGWILFGADAVPAAAGWSDYEALIAAADPDGPAGGARGVHQREEGVARRWCKGRPKGAMRTHDGNALIALATALEFGLNRDDTGLLVMPLCHANSLYFALTFAMLGATIVIDERRSFDAAATLATLARERIRFTSLVPTHYILMLALPEEARAGLDLAAVGKLLISSAPARAETKRAILGLFPNAKLFELYGSTEAGWVTVLRPQEQLDHLGTVGREWAGSGAIRLLDDAGREVRDGEVGELFSTTPWVFAGYWRDEAKTRQAFDTAGACSVGDMALRDAEGFIRLVDRKSNMIISGGENIYPSEVEAVLAAHPAVQDVAVLGVPEPTWGEAVLAAVVLQPGHDATAAQAELDRWCRASLAGFKRPRQWVFIAEAQMPRTATGKIQHRVLKQRLLATAGAPATA